MTLKEISSNVSCKSKTINLQYREHQLNQTCLLVEKDVLTTTAHENLLPIGLFSRGLSKTTAWEADQAGPVQRKENDSLRSLLPADSIPLGFLLSSPNSPNQQTTALRSTDFLSCLIPIPLRQWQTWDNKLQLLCFIIVSKQCRIAIPKVRQCPPDRLEAALWDWEHLGLLPPNTKYRVTVKRVSLNLINLDSNPCSAAH